MNGNIPGKQIDNIGIWVTSLCALHCILLPFVLPFAPMLADSLFSESWFERLVLLTSLSIGLWALVTGFNRYHKKVYPFYLLAFGGITYWYKDAMGEAWEPYILSTGAVFIVAAHLINLRLKSRVKRRARASNPG